MKRLFFLVYSIMGVTCFAQQPVQNFSLTNVADGNTVSLEGFQSCNGLVVLFTSNECAFDSYYTGRIKSLISNYKDRIQFLLINSYTEPAESIDKMKTKYTSWTPGVPYLADKDQTAMECLGAKKSPEVFLLKNTGGKYFIVYSGAIDDNPQVATDVKQFYLKDAIENLLANQKADLNNIRAVGCSIRRK
jgi:AhpC/TSA family